MSFRSASLSQATTTKAAKGTSLTWIQSTVKNMRIILWFISMMLQEMQQAI